MSFCKEHDVLKVLNVTFVHLCSFQDFNAACCRAYNSLYLPLNLHRLIRLTSPNLNYLIGIGAIVLYIDVCFFVIPSTDKVTVTVFCNVSFLHH